jgi:hypothetical protein
MNRGHLPENFIDNPEALIREARAKLKKSTLRRNTSSNSEDRRSFIRNLSTEFAAMVNKTIREFSAPTTDNIRTGPAAAIDKNFELKPGLINMVQANQFCGKPHEDASAHL